MGQRDDCIFCKIVMGQIPCIKVYEDEKALAFMDIAPLNNGHVLVIPRNHYETITDIEPETYGWLAGVASRIAAAIRKSLKPDGINIMQLNGKAANQVVPHLHIHIVPRIYGDGLTICAWEPIPGSMDQIKATAQSLIANL